MMPDFIFNTVSSLKISYLKLFGDKLVKLLISISDEYYSYISEGVIHEEALHKIMKQNYIDNPKALDDCKYFVFNRKQTIDSIYESKYGKSGRFMSHLFKLIQKIYLDKHLDDGKSSYETELTKSMTNLNKKFNNVVLYMFSKYNA